MTNTTHRVLTPQGQYAQEGDLATMRINTDAYVVGIDRVTPKTITVVSMVKQPDGTYAQSLSALPRTFRWNEKRQQYVYAQNFILTLGEAVSHSDPSF